MSVLLFRCGHPRSGKQGITQLAERNTRLESFPRVADRYFSEKIAARAHFASLRPRGHSGRCCAQHNHHDIQTHMTSRLRAAAWQTFNETFNDFFNNRVRGRSEEHTSELQSLRHLVCRLLLEKT